MEEKMCQTPAFGSWHYCEPVIQARMTTHRGVFGEEDLFKVPVAMPMNSAYLNGGHYSRKARKRNGVVVVEKQFSSGGTPRKSRALKAADEDLYKIPQELLYQKPKRKRLLRNLLSGCLCISCIP